MFKLIFIVISVCFVGYFGRYCLSIDFENMIGKDYVNIVILSSFLLMFKKTWKEACKEDQK